jgi:hypothetical protein
MAVLEKLVSAVTPPWSERDARVLMLLILLAGVVLRLAWLFTGGHTAPLGGESQNVAVSLATGHGFANAYTPTSGPTAHLSPTTPLLPAAVYALFGPLTPTSEVILSVISILVTAGGIALLYDCMKELGADVVPRLAAVFLAALFPFQFALEVVEFRTWEAGFATLCAIAILLAALRSDRATGLPWPRLFLFAVACGALAMISPGPALASAAVFGMLLLRRGKIVQWPVGVAVVVATTVALSIPWALRNEQVMGERIWMRSTAGIQKAMTYADGVLTEDPSKFYNERHRALMPVYPDNYQRLVAAGGELAYFDGLGEQADAWIKAHPEALPHIWLRNLRDFYLPPERFYNRFGAKAQMGELRRQLTAGLSILGLATLLALIPTRHWRYLYPAALVAVASVPYILTYPLMRYRYIISYLLIFLALDGLWRIATLIRTRTTNRGRP